MNNMLILIGVFCFIFVVGFLVLELIDIRIKKIDAQIEKAILERNPVLIVQFQNSKDFWVLVYLGMLILFGFFFLVSTLSIMWKFLMFIFKL